MGIAFRFNALKAEQVIAWLAVNCPSPTKHKVSKILFFADKAHLNKYGRPILGDKYAAMKFGPVPSSVLNMINGEHPKEDGQDYNFELSGKTLRVRDEAKLDLEHLTKSDLEELNAAIQKYGSMGFDQITHVSHDEVAWKKAAHWMNYEDFIEDSDLKQEITEYLEETSHLVLV